MLHMLCGQPCMPLHASHDVTYRVASKIGYHHSSRVDVSESQGTAKKNLLYGASLTANAW